METKDLRDVVEVNGSIRLGYGEVAVRIVVQGLATQSKITTLPVAPTHTHTHTTHTHLIHMGLLIRSDYVH